MTLKRLILLVLAIALVAAPIAESATFSDSPSAGAAKKKKGKCKKGKKGKKGKKCKKKGGGGGSGPGGLPGKPVSPEPGGGGEEPGAQLLLAGMSLDENPLLAGSTGEGQVTINAPAPSPGGQPVTLSSGVPGRASVPDSVHIAAGQTSADFDITTTAGPDETVTLTAAIGASVRTAELGIVEEESLLGLALDYQCFPDTNLDDFGASVVSLDVRAPENVTVNLSSDAPGFLEVPPTMLISENSFSGAFSVDTGPTMTTTPITVTATYDGEQVTDTATVRDSGSPNPIPANVGLQPASVVVGDPSTGTVSLDCEAPAAAGVTVTLASDHPNAHVPASVVVPPGELSATFPITTDLSGTPGQAHITASSPGSAIPFPQATLTLRAIGT